METLQEGPLALPSVEAVLDKVKSDGTFDQFRKTCLAAVEAEPSMRAYGEQIEVLSRRYLQDHHHKWSDSITKNEVRAKLKDYIIKMIANPDVGISIPVQNMVENSLEKNGPKILLPQVIDALTALQKTAQKAPNPTTNSTPASSEPTQGDSVPVESAPGKINSELGPLDLPLPISIPGLNTSGSGRKESGGGESGVKTGSKNKEGSAEQLILKAKPKSKASGDSGGGATSGNKEAKQGAVKSQKGSSGKPIGKEGSKLKEKSPVDDQEDSKESSHTEDGISKEKGRGIILSGRVKKTLKEEKLGQREKDSEKQSDRKGNAKEKETATADQKEVVRKESSGKREKDLKDGTKPELTPETSDQTTEQKPRDSRDDHEDGRKEPNEDEVEDTKRSGPASSGSGVSTSRRKQPTPKRRSARLASLNEESSDEQGKTKAKSSSQTEENKEDSSTAVMADTGRKRATTAEKAKSATTTRASGRKRLRVLESSSDEERIRQSSTEDEEKGYESETEQGKEEEGRRRKRKRVRGRESTRRPEDTQSQMSENSKRLGQKRSLGACKDDREERRSNSPITKKVRRPSGKQLQEERKQSPAKQKSPSPVVVTRYNRRVKPNRRYNTSPGHDSASSVSNDDNESPQNTKPRQN